MSLIIYRSQNVERELLPVKGQRLQAKVKPWY